MTLKKVFFSLITNQLTIFVTSYFQRSVQRLFSTSDGSCKSFVQNPSDEIEMVANHQHVVTSSVSKNEAEERKLHSATIVKGKRVNYPSNDCQVKKKRKKKREREKRKSV